jgi:hypothetical protein
MKRADLACHAADRSGNDLLPNHERWEIVAPESEKGDIATLIVDREN